MAVPDNIFVVKNGSNTLGPILSSYIDLLNILSGGGGTTADLTALTGLTANWQSTYTTVSANSASWGSGGSPQTLTFNESNAQLSISFGNTVSLSSLSGGSGVTGDYLPLSGGTITGSLNVLRTLSGTGTGYFSAIRIGPSWVENELGSFESSMASFHTSAYGRALIDIRNEDGGPESLTDLIITNDIGSESSYFLDIGFTSSTYNQGVTASNFPILGPNNAYMYAQDADLLIGIAQPQYKMRFIVGGGEDQYEVFRLTTAGMSLNNLLSTNNIIKTTDSGSPQWTESYTFVNSNSADWYIKDSILAANSATWSTAYSFVTGNSAYIFSAISNLAAASGKWDSTYTTVNANSASWNLQFILPTDVTSNTARWNEAYTYSNTTSGKIFDNLTSLNSNSGSWSQAYTYSNSNSALIRDNLTALETTSSRWESNYTSTNTNSGFWQSTYTTVNANSAFWGDTSLPTNITSNTAKWDEAYTYSNTTSGKIFDNLTSLESNSGSWGNAYTYSNANSSRINDNLTTVITNSGNWSQAYTYTNSISSRINDNLTSLETNSGRWESNYTTTNVNSAFWQSNYTTVNVNSGSWSQAYSYGNSNSARIDDNLSTVVTNSATWGSGGTPQILTYNEGNAQLSISFGNTVSLSSLTGGGGSITGEYLPLTGGAITGSLSVSSNLVVGGNTTIFGNLSVLSGFYVTGQSIITSSSALSVVNTGPGPGLYVKQVGAIGDIASFYDLYNNEVLHIRAFDSNGGRVGINESEPQTEFSVKGTISASNLVYAINGNSDLWNASYSYTNSNSGRIDDNLTVLEANSSKWYNEYLPLSGGLLSSTDISNSIILSMYGGLSSSGTGYFSSLRVGYYDQVVFESFPNAFVTMHADIDSYAEINVQNANAGTSASSDIVATSDIGAEGTYYIDLGINGSNYSNPSYTIGGPNDGYLYVQDGNLAIGTSIPTFDVILHAGGTLYTDEMMRIRSDGNVTLNVPLSSNNIFKTTDSNSNEWTEAYTYASGNSGLILDNLTTLESNSSKWESTYSTVNSNSATWGTYLPTDITANSAYWQSSYTTLSSNSGGWENAYTYSNGNSARINDNLTTVITNSGNWSQAYTNTNSNSGKWDSNYTTTNTGSGSWNNAYTYSNSNSSRINDNLTIVVSNSSRWENAYTYSNSNSSRINDNLTTVITNSGNWSQAYTNTNSNSGKWDSNYTTTNTNSGRWENAYTYSNSNSGRINDNLTSLTTNSGKWESTYSTVNSNSASWGTSSGGLPTDVTANTGRWESNYTTTNAFSSNWQNAFTYSNSNSARIDDNLTVVVSNSGNWGQAFTITNANSGRWETNYTTTNSNSSRWENAYIYSNSNSARIDDNLTSLENNSGRWESTYTTVNSNSATWGGSTGGLPTDVTANTGRWESNYVTTNTYSGRWEEAYTTTNTFSTNWDNAYSYSNSNSARIDNNLTTLVSNSGHYEEAYTYSNSISSRIASNTSTLTANSGSWTEAYTTTNANSAFWTARTIRSFTLEAPEAGDVFTCFYNGGTAVTLSAIKAIVSGTTPSVNILLRYGLDRSAAGSNLVNQTTVNNTTNGQVLTLVTATIPLDNYVWLSAGTTAGTTVNDVNITFVI